jgi:hypothetical protein
MLVATGTEGGGCAPLPRPSGATRPPYHIILLFLPRSTPPAPGGEEKSGTGGRTGPPTKKNKINACPRPTPAGGGRCPSGGGGVRFVLPAPACWCRWGCWLHVLSLPALLAVVAGGRAAAYNRGRISSRGGR